MPARLTEVAEYAGVSVATASRVVNGRPGVSETSRRSVLAAVDVLGYSRPATLQPRRLGLIGVVVAELGNPIFPLFAQAIEQSLPSFGYTALLATRQLGAPAEQASIELLQEHGVSGFVFVSGIHSDTLADLEHYRALRAQGVPLAFINGQLPDFDATFVAADDVAGTELAVRHLYELGHRRIGLATGSARYTPSARKLEGFRSAVSRLGTGTTGAQHLGDYSVEGGHAAALELLDQGCTGIVAASDLLALGVIRGIRSRGLRVPADVSVVGWDGSPIMAFTDPPLTTVRQPIQALASAATRSLIEDIEGTPRPRTELLFAPELIVRGSTGAAADRTTPVVRRGGRGQLSGS